MQDTPPTSPIDRCDSPLSIPMPDIRDLPLSMQQPLMKKEVCNEVLTSLGWVPISQINLNTDIVTLVDDKLAYTKPTSISVDHNFKGEMYTVETDDVNLDIPLNYRLYASRDGTNFELMPPPDDQELYFKQLADNGEDSSGFTWFQMKLIDSDWYERFEKQSEEARRTGDYSKVEYPESVRVTNEELVELWKKLPDEHDKEGLKFIDTLCYLNGDGRYLNTEQARMLIDALSDDDGCYVTDREYNANAFQKICLYAGYVGFMREEGNQYKVEICRAEMDEPVMGGFYDYEGSVYDLRVPTGLVYMRRKGTPVWIGTPVDEVKQEKEMVVEQTQTEERQETSEKSSEEPPKKKRKWFIF